jgi:hypothetical protein
MEIFTIADLYLSFLIAGRCIHTSSHTIPPRDGGEPYTTKLTKRLPTKSLDSDLLPMVLPRNNIAQESWMTPP